MEGTAKSDPDRWWIAAVCVAVAGIALAALLWNFPTSMLVWTLAGGILIFVVVAYLNPRYRYWRRANACFGTAAILAFVPTFVAKANLQEFGAFEIASESSPLVVLSFLGAGLFLSWLDSRHQMHSRAKAGVASSHTNLSSVNSPQAIMGLTSGRDIFIHQGISEETFLAAIDAQRIAQHVHASSASESRAVDEELVWRLVDDIKAARRRFEREEVAKLLTDLWKSFDRSGNSWPKVLRTEALLLMAEEERAKISQSRTQGHQADLGRLQELLQELRDA